MTYGHLTLAQFEQRQGNPYFEEHGRWYRITETYIIRALDRVNYQAEECDPREAQAWLAEQTASAEEPEQSASVPAGPLLRSDDDDWLPSQSRKGVMLEVVEQTAEPIEERVWTESHPRPPRLAEWAREHGWAGRGPIPKAVKRAYEDEFGVKTYSY